MKPFKRISAMLFALAMALVLVACGGNVGDAASSPTEADDAAQTDSAGQSADAVAEATGELMGKPWVTSILQGNLPTEQPEAKDDLFTHCNYEYLAEHQVQPSSAPEDHAAELQTANLAVIKDQSKSSHDLDQLRIFFNQAADAEGLKKEGLSGVQPYLDRIDAVGSIDEMNALLSASDFPFSPFTLATITLSDTRDVNIVNVSPNFALVDTIMVGGTYYQDSDDPQMQESMLAALQNSGGSALLDLMVVGMGQEELQDAFEAILQFEKAHGKYADYNGKYSMEDFGVMAEAARNSIFTLDELCSACPNFPIKATLDKEGKGTSPRYMSTREWLEAFNELWTNDNLETIKLIAKVKVLNETRPYRDPSVLNAIMEQSGQPVPDAESFAYAACDHMNTFAITLANSYVDEVLGANAKERLTKLSQDLIDTYKDLMGNTPWLGAESQKRVIEKLDHITLNVLEPTGGYYDFSGVELTPTDKGGTLIGNYLKLKQYRLDQESKMVGQPAVAACPWFTIEPTITNAFYDPVSNSVNILPGFVTSLVYTDDMSEQDLLAGVGFTIGHEISHGFDYQGAQFDAYGTPNPLFVDADVDTFVLKASSLASYYKTIEITPGLMVNGENVVTEAAADLCGMQAALELAGKSEGTDYDAFFQKNASIWAQVVPEAMLPTFILDTHTLHNQRVNVNAQMFDPIYEQLGVKEGDTMYLAPEERINIWGPNA